MPTEQRARSAGERRQALVVALVIAVTPLVVIGARIVYGFGDAAPASDMALLELSTDEATRGAQRLGPYSRFGWRHPGPALFYLFAPFYGISGGHSASLPLAALAINWVALLGIVLGVRRWAEGALTPWLTLALTLAYLAYLGPGFLYNPWNPAVTVLPLGLLLLLCARVACGRVALLPLIAALGSFLVQTHIGYLPVTAIAVLIGAALGLRAATVPALRPLLGSGAVLVVFWALPVLEQFTRTPGNLTAIAGFFVRGSEQHGVAEAAAIVARELAWPWCFALFGPRDQYAPYPPLEGWRLAVAAAFACTQVVLLAIWSIRLRARPFTRALAGVCLAGTVVALPTVMGISGEVRPYLTTWLSMLGVLGTLAAVAPLLPAWALSRWTALVLPVGVAAAFGLLGRPVVRDSQYPAAMAVGDIIQKALRQGGGRRAQVSIETRNPALFYAASAVLLQLHKRGVAFAVDRPWWNFFGERWKPTGHEDALLHFHAQPGPSPLTCVPNPPGQLCVTLGRN